MGSWQETGMIALPADGPVSWTAREDAAEAAAVILASRGAYEGPVTLTASAAPTFQDLAQIATELTGRTIEPRVIDEDDWVAAQTGTGQTESATRFTLGIFQAAHKGFFAGVDPLLGTLLGREPSSVRDALARLISTQRRHE